LQNQSALFPELDGKCSPDQLTAFIDDIANTEIDLLIEDHDYFIFVEAKDPPDGKPPRFQIRRGVHQLVLQYAEGLFLAKKIKKPSGQSGVGPRQLLDLRIEHSIESIV
jgi:hypothetical protein